MKAGKMTLAGTTVTPDPRKGLLILRKDDGLMHLIWKDRATGTVEEDLIIFQGDASLRHVPQCADGFGMLLEFSSGRRFFFWSQEPRKKDLGWGEDDAAKEFEMLEQANAILNGTPAATAGAPSPSTAAAGGFDGMSQDALMAMLTGGASAAAPAAAGADGAEAGTAAATAATAAAAAAAESDVAPSAPAAGGFSADSIASALSAASGAPASAPAAAPPAFTADSIANLLGSMPQPNPPVSLNSVLSADATVPLVDRSMEASLAEHIPPGTSVAETLQTPQLQQVCAPKRERGGGGSRGGSRERGRLDVG